MLFIIISYFLHNHKHKFKLHVADFTPWKNNKMEGTQQ